MGTPNWAALYKEGRCKGIGVPWSEEELYAITKLNIPVDYVRDGILDLDSYAKELEKESKEGKKPLSRKTIKELMKQAEELKIPFTPDATKDSLVKAINNFYKSKEQAAKQARALEEAFEKEKKFQIEQRAKLEKEIEKKKDEAKKPKK